MLLSAFFFHILGGAVAGQWVQEGTRTWGWIRRATLPPTWLFGHHHPGSGVCLPALAHHTFGKRHRWWSRRKHRHVEIKQAFISTKKHLVQNIQSHLLPPPPLSILRRQQSLQLWWTCMPGPRGCTLSAGCSLWGTHGTWTHYCRSMWSTCAFIRNSKEGFAPRAAIRHEWQAGFFSQGRLYWKGKNCSGLRSSEVRGGNTPPLHLILRLNEHAVMTSWATSCCPGKSSSCK